MEWTRKAVKVFVYYNLHRHLFSIKALEGNNRGKVIAHASSVVLSNAVFKVSVAGRMRVLREQRKNVHAGVIGEWDGQCEQKDVDLMVSVKYDPYKYSTFVVMPDQQPIHYADKVWLIDKRVYV